MDKSDLRIKPTDAMDRRKWKEMATAIGLVVQGCSLRLRSYDKTGLRPVNRSWSWSCRSDLARF